ncbi:MAG: DUF1343 domain-containing protein [Bacteroidia bacterium]|nr:DUF1343 domain-containing protein [Bacteroidia bacterium]
MKNILLLIVILRGLAFSQGVEIGASILLREHLEDLKGKKLGLVVNQTSVVGNTHLVDTLLKVGCQVTAIFAPEHGFRGDADAGAQIKDGIDAKTGIIIYSLFGKILKPTPEMLANIDVILFDIQDIGARFYTYISTLSLVMEAAAEQDKEVWVLDRPNPNGDIVAGPVLEREFSSFVGKHEIPILHGLTVAEYANMVNGERWLKNGLQCKLKLILMKKWHHSMPWEETGLKWIKPSPNIPDLKTARWYPYVCWFEGVNVSVGRGTYKPFLFLGAPYVSNRTLLYLRGLYDLDTVYFTPVSIKGMATHPPFELQTCKGINLNTPPAQANECFELSLELLRLFYQNSGKRPDFFQPSFIKLCGTDKIKADIIAEKQPKEIIFSWQDKLYKYQQKRKKYLLYPE